MFGTLERLERGEHVMIVCMGDSITEQNLHLRGRLNYVGQWTETLMDRYGRKSLILNAGKSGETTWGALERLERDALRYKPDLVTFMYGMNDSTRGWEHIPQFKRNLESILEQVMSSGSDILLLTPNMLDYGVNEEAVQARTSYPDYILAIREVAAAAQVPFCDIYDRWGAHIGGSTNAHLMLMNDSIHPNVYGHRLIAASLLKYAEKPDWESSL